MLNMFAKIKGQLYNLPRNETPQLAEITKLLIQKFEAIEKEYPNEQINVTWHDEKDIEVIAPHYVLTRLGELNNKHLE